MTNSTIATHLLAHARSLEERGHGLYRVRAYRRAAAVIRMLPCEVSDLLDMGGVTALKSIRGIGEHIAFTVERLVRTGELVTLGPRPEHTDPRERVMSLPGVGTATARRLNEGWGITTVEGVEDAVKDGRLRDLGLPERSIENLATVLELRKKASPPTQEPSVSDLLAVDDEYRRLGASALTVHRNGWTFRASYSSSPLAYRLGQTRDWVVIRFAKDELAGERVVVSESRPPWRGQRVVRGREHECQACWAS
jgi:Helix-hairpin-helix domain